MLSLRLSLLLRQLPVLDLLLHCSLILPVFRLDRLLHCSLILLVHQRGRDGVCKRGVCEKTGQAIHNPQSAIRNLQSAIRNPELQPAIRTPESTTTRNPEPQSAIRNPESTTSRNPEPQSAIRNPELQSAMRNPRITSHRLSLSLSLSLYLTSHRLSLSLSQTLSLSLLSNVCHCIGADAAAAWALRVVM